MSIQTRINARSSQKVSSGGFAAIGTSPTVSLTSTTGGGGSLPPQLVPVGPAARVSRKNGLWRQAVRLDTLGGQFNVLALTGAILSLVVLVTSYNVLVGVSTNFNRVISESAPSVLAANELGQNLNLLDTAAADFQVTNRMSLQIPADLSKARSDAEASYNASRQAFSDSLFRAYANITFPGEREAIAGISKGFYDYLARIEVALNYLKEGRREDAIAKYKEARDLILAPNATGIEANVEKLANINENELKKAFRLGQTESATGYLLLGLAGLLLVIALGLTALRYALVTHRVINWGYVTGLLVVLVMTIILSGLLAKAAGDFKTVGQDSFVSINAATRAQQILRDFNGDESRLLLNPSGPGLDQSIRALNNGVKDAFSLTKSQQNFSQKEAQLREQLRLAWANVTYPNERIALCAIANNPSAGYGQPGCTNAERPRNQQAIAQSYALDNYLAQHKIIIELYLKGDEASLNTAIRTSFGPSNVAADTISQSLDQLKRVNQAEFDRAANESLGSCADKDCKVRGNGYLSLLEGLSLFVFTLLALVIISGAWLSRKLF